MDDPVYFVFLVWIGLLLVYGAVRLAIAYLSPEALPLVTAFAFLFLMIGLLFARLIYGPDPFRHLETEVWRCVTKNRDEQKLGYVCPPVKASRPSWPIESVVR